MNNPESKTQKPASQWDLMISSLPPTPPEELERREQAALNLRSRLIQIPWYADADRRHGMAFWRKLQASAVLSDGLNYRQHKK